MKVTALFKNGETLDRSDRETLAIMKKLGFPRDYLAFMLRFGNGEFADPLLSLNSPTLVLHEILKPDLTFTIKQPVQVGSFQGGAVMAVNHVGHVLFEYWPRVESEPRPVFTSLESLLEGLQSSEFLKDTSRVYDQDLPKCSLTKIVQEDHPPKQSDTVIKEIVALSIVDDFVFLPYPEALEMFSERLGFSVVFNWGRSITLKFRYEAKLKKPVEVLTKHGWKLDRDPMNIHLRLLEEEI